ncbi:hypothetical protein CPB86DRAFT_567990 [Serendipita vermifera]|nr:hypothetical protein CPB86DRAFT_567990 [Serendipita vermifera]
MKIAVEGCCHGSLDKSYEELKNLEDRIQQRVDALIICGDFESVRNEADLLCMAVPQKYRHLGDFHEYYAGQKVAPVLTIVVGGNHEASNYLYHGGWLAPNIYYLGGSGCVRLNGIRIAGASGIFKRHDYNLSHFEKVPYNNKTLRSVYHVRAYDVYKLSLLSPGPEVMISHDWPEGIYNHGDMECLLKVKPWFKQGIDKQDLGNPHMMTLLKTVRPSWWFSAHMHARFTAEYNHTSDVSDLGKGGASESPLVKNADEIVMDDDEDEPIDTIIAAQDTKGHSGLNSLVVGTAVASSNGPSSGSSAPSTTNFLALDKCFPDRKFIEIVDIPSPQSHSPPRLTFGVVSHL